MTVSVRRDLHDHPSVSFPVWSTEVCGQEVKFEWEIQESSPNVTGVCGKLLRFQRAHHAEARLHQLRFRLGHAAGQESRVGPLHRQLPCVHSFPCHEHDALIRAS